MDKNWQIQIMEHYPTVQQIKPNVINKLTVKQKKQSNIFSFRGIALVSFLCVS